ncbi:MAG: nucleotide sugar dehydrogenase [Chloroflexales bacterium]
MVGLWHLGTVTAACLASVGHDVVGLDFEPDTVAKLSAGQAPLFEPGLDALLQQGLADGRLRFSADPDEALAGAEVVWVTYDTPVDDDDRADVTYVVERVARLFPALEPGALVLISSQLPVGSTRRLEQVYAAAHPDRQVSFAYSPENLRLGKAISVFTQPDRVVAGVRNAADQQRVAALLGPITERVEWMGVESAEMTKHALNAFLATSVTFINEVATLCEQVGADAKEVERGLKSEVRIGPRAYLGPGGAFAGGTLARDINFLSAIGAAHDRPTHLISAVRASNDAHKSWAGHRLEALLSSLAGRRIAVWGLTYKPGTDTLRRSSAVELCRWLVTQGAQVQAHDPAVTALPADLANLFSLHASPLDALAGAAALVVATEWPDYQAIAATEIVATMERPVVVDANRFLARTLGDDPRIRYAAVGKSL